MTDRTLISAQDLADLLGLSVDTIWRYTREKLNLYQQVGVNFEHPSFPGLTFAVDDVFKKP